MFQLFVQFLPGSGILLCCSRKKNQKTWYFILTIKACVNENTSKTTTLAKNLSV